MNDEHDSELGRLLGEYFHRRLDGQIGRASRRFLAAISASRRPVRNWTLGAALAATVAAASTLSVHALIQSRQPNVVAVPSSRLDPSPPRQTVNLPLVELSRTSHTAVLDDGLVDLGDGSVARKFRREVVEQVQWYDPQRKTIVRQDIPQTQVLFIGSDVY